jgi:transcriptional regulator with XRE-family HTH domain
MNQTKRTEARFATPAVTRQAKLLGRRVRQARQARLWSQVELAERARTSTDTIKRLEQGSVAVSFGAWLGVLERLGLLAQLDAVQDPAANALLLDALPKRVRKRKLPPDALDF